MLAKWLENYFLKCFLAQFLKMSLSCHLFHQVNFFLIFFFWYNQGISVLPVLFWDCLRQLSWMLKGGEESN